MKVFKDPIHRDICIPDYCVEVIDTPEFQRLRNIKQVGAAEAVYPGATHTRFAHSIGVSYLAGVVIKQLKENQPDLDISDEEEKCVRLAGLCHDLGHGPLSHKFETVVKELLPDGETWQHEDASVAMLHHLNGKNKIGLHEEELNLICDLISGKPPKDADKERHDRYKKKRFLYQIVANKDTGIDVDKWDYFARDCHYLGIGNSFDHLRIIPFMRVCECKREVKDDDGNILRDEDGNSVTETMREICYRDKLIRDVGTMFAVRWDLHDKAVQHKVVKLIETMYADAFKWYFSSKNVTDDPRLGPIDVIIKDMEKYSQLGDHILGAIARSNGELEKAREIIKRIQTRDLYKCIGEILDAGKDVPEDDQIKSSLIEKDPESILSEKNLIVVSHKYDYGMGEKNPLKEVYFYTKEDDKRGVKFGDEKMPPNFPAKFNLRDVRIYTRKRVDKKELAGIRKKIQDKLSAITVQARDYNTPKSDPSGEPPKPHKGDNPRSNPETSQSKRKLELEDEPTVQDDTDAGISRKFKKKKEEK